MNGRKRNVVLDSIASSEPTPRVGNLDINRCRHDLVPDSIGSRSGMLGDESGSYKTHLPHKPGVTTLQIGSYSGLDSSPYGIPSRNHIEDRPVYLVYYG